MVTVIILSLASVLAAGQAGTAAGVVAGRVLEEGTNRPIADARLMILPVSPGLPQPNLRREAVSDPEGRYVFEAIEPGRYRITVQKAGYASPDPLSPPPLVTIAAGQTLTGVNHVLQRGGVITGRILDSAAQPVTDARVSAMRRLPSRGSDGRLVPAGQGVQTNDLGEFRLYGLPAGEYYIQAAPRPEPPFGNTAQRSTVMAPTFYPGTADPATAAPVAVAAGQTVNDVVFSVLVVPAYQISGVVVDESGQPVAGAMVMAMRDPSGGIPSAGPPARGQSDGAGRFVIANVTSGAYLLDVAAPLITASSSQAAGGGASTAVTGGVSASGSGGVATVWSSVETRGGTTIQYRSNPGNQVRITVGDDHVSGVQLVAKRPPQ
jgi:hypothetical protein